MGLKPEELATLRQKHGVIRVWELDDGRTFAFKRAKGSDWRTWKASQMQVITAPDVAARANEMAARALCVYPDQKAFDELRDSDPMVADEIGSELIADAGTGVKASEAK
jgi:hypothetical protein